MFNSMCGRYTLRRVALVYAAMGAVPYLPGFDEFDEKQLIPRFNVAPSQRVPIVRLEQGKRVLDFASWGFVPSWARGEQSLKPINAKAETVASSKMFKSAFSTSRCLLPADGFYEWKPTKPKQPFFFHRPDDKIFAFAGICSGSTCLLITTEPNQTVKPVHARMPLILDEADYQRWLDPAADIQTLQSMMKPSPADELLAQPAGTAVNKATNDDPSLINPPEGGLFG